MLVFLDASAVIYLLEGDLPTREAVRQVLRGLGREAGEAPMLGRSGGGLRHRGWRLQKDS